MHYKVHNNHQVFADWKEIKKYCTAVESHKDACKCARKLDIYRDHGIGAFELNISTQTRTFLLLISQMNFICVIDTVKSNIYIVLNLSWNIIGLPDSNQMLRHLTSPIAYEPMTQ